MTQPASTETPAPRPAPLQRGSLLTLGPPALLVATVIASAGSWHWILDLASHFRCYYFALALIWLLALCRQRWRSPQICLTLAVIWNGWLILPYYWPEVQRPRPAATTTVSIISLNVFTANPDKAAVVSYLRDRHPDLIVVMEVDVDWAFALQELKDLYPHRLIQPRADNFGIGLLSKWPLTDAKFVEFAGTELPNVVARIHRDGHEFQIVATHPLPPIGAFHSQERNAQLRELADFVKRSNLTSIVAGDFNATPWSVGFRQFAVRSELKDSALGRGIQGTWNAKTWLIRIPIDHIFVPAGSIVTSRAVGPSVGSDHFPVEATIVLPWN